MTHDDDHTQITDSDVESSVFGSSTQGGGQASDLDSQDLQIVPFDFFTRLDRGAEAAEYRGAEDVALTDVALMARLRALAAPTQNQRALRESFLLFF